MTSENMCQKSGTLRRRKAGIGIIFPLIFLLMAAICFLSTTGTAAAVTADEPIAGISSVSAQQLETALSSVNPGHIHPDIADLYIKWGQRFGIKADLAFAQMLHETNYLRYTGDVKPWQNNFAGIGATGGGNPGNSFPNAEAGVIAHYAHLAWYIFPNHVNEYCNSTWDPRHFGTTHNNSVRTLRDLGGKWAVPGLTYGDAIAGIASGIWDYSDSSYYPPIIGNLDGLYPSGPGRFSIYGWAIDPNTSDPIEVHVYVNGQWGDAVYADENRADVGTIFASYGSYHGFSMDLDNIPDGMNQICAYGINDGPGGNGLLGCKTLGLPLTPFGSLDSVASGAPGRLDIYGWAIDTDTADPIDVHVYLDGKWGGAIRADGDRLDVDDIYPGFGPIHGYEMSISNVPEGQHTLCTYGINDGSGGNSLLGCSTFEMPTNPFGNLDNVSFSGPGRLDLYGWAIDPNTADPIDVHFYLDGQWGGATRADEDRPDVDDIYPGFGSGHGYEMNIDNVPEGSHTLCAFGINDGPEGNSLLGCRTVNVGASPFGNLDSVSSSAGSLNLHGWTIDPDTADPIDVHIYLDGHWAGALKADGGRPDVGGIYPGFGPLHGYEFDISDVSQGAHTVCAYGINTGPGENTLLRCVTI